MNTRERFLAVLDFNKDVHSLKWDFGIWGEAVDNWYAQGLPKKALSGDQQGVDHTHGLTLWAGMAKRR